MTEEEYILHLEANLEGKPKKWFKGVKDLFFTTISEFEVELTEIYGVPIISSACEIVEKIRNIRLRKGSIEETLVELFSIKQNTLSLEEILSIISKDLPSNQANRLISKSTWTEVIKEAMTMYQEYNEMIKSKSITKCTAVSKTPDSNGTLSKKKVECLICQGNHYANLCPSKSKAVSKSS